MKSLTGRLRPHPGPKRRQPSEDLAHSSPPFNEDKKKLTWKKVRGNIYFVLAAIVVVPVGVIAVTCFVCYEECSKLRKGNQDISPHLRPGQPQRPNPYQHLLEIERATGQTISIETARTKANLSKCTAQDQSPLFALPAEIRLLIFEFVLSPSEKLHDLNRPSPRRRQRCSYELLLTCRLIWLEANALGLRQAEPTFIATVSNPFARPVPEGLDSFRETLTPNNLVLLNQIRIISDLRWLPYHWYVNNFNSLMGSWQPRKVRITLWYADRDLCTSPLWADGTSIWVPGLRSLNGAVCALLNTASETSTEELEVELVGRAAAWFAELEQCAENLRIDKQYLDHCPWWSMVQERQTFEDASQSKSGLDIVKNSFTWRRVTSHAAAPVNDAGIHQEASESSEPSLDKIQKTTELWTSQHSLLMFKEPVSK